jgi:hypothetical protein
LRSAATPAPPLAARFRLWLVFGCAAFLLVPALREPGAWFGSPWLVLVAAPLAGSILTDARATLELVRRPIQALRARTMRARATRWKPSR